MSLMRFLAAGRSLMGGDDPTNRYRLPRRQAMPHFGGEANPFASTVHPGGERAGNAGLAAATEAPAAPTPQVQTEPIAKQPVKRSWLARLGLFRRVEANVASPVLAVRAPARQLTAVPALTQPELSLLAVQVVRNDLSDADEAPPRSRLKGRELLGRAFPRVPRVDFSLDDELAGDSLPPQAEEAAQAKLL